MASLCHPWFTTTNLSYRFPIFETSATALCGTTGVLRVIVGKSMMCILLSLEMLRIFHYIYSHVEPHIFPRWGMLIPQWLMVWKMTLPMGWWFHFFYHIFPRGMFPRCSLWLVNPPFQEVYRSIAASLEKLGLGSFLIPWGRFDVHSAGRNPSTNITLAPHPSLACNWICSVWVSQVCGYWIFGGSD